MDDYIVFEEVTKTYHVGEMEINALAGISFTISKGQFVIICGASGAGKTTVLNLLGGMDTKSAGKIIVDNKDIGGLSGHDLATYRRLDVGFVFQFYNLIQNLTARENVELASQVSKNALKIDDVLEQVGLTDRRKNFPSQLSGGEQQRVAIARAMAKNPKLLLCDEPTGALDYTTGRSILKLLQDTCRNSGITVVVITHNLALMPMGHKVIRLKSGLIDAITDNHEPVSIDRIEW